MISIIIDAPKKLRPVNSGDMSAFVSFPYEADIVQFIRELPVREYLPEIYTWEVPVASVHKICSRFIKYDIEIKGVLNKVSRATISLPASFKFKTDPFAHQLEFLQYALSHDVLLLGDQQGLGKTKEVIDLAKIRKLRGEIKRCLVICGINGNKYNWENEVSTHSDESAWILGSRFTKRTHKRYEGTAHDRLDDLKALPDCLFIITNVETLRLLSHKDETCKKKKKPNVYPIVEQINKLIADGEIGMVVFDEIQKVKNPESQQGEAFLGIQPQGQKQLFMIGASGTPLMNNPLEAYVPLRWLGYESHSYYQFKQHYCQFGGYQGKDIVGYKNLEELRELFEIMMIRRLKKDVLDLPEKMFQVEYVEMYPDQKKVYNEVTSELRERIDKIKLSPNPLAEMIRLRQATAYPGILSSTIMESAKMDRMVELVEDAIANGEKCIIYSNWEQVTFVAKRKLFKFKPAYVTGQINKMEDRMAEIDKFQNDDNCKVIIGTIGALGTGFTLTAANTVIFLDSPWNQALKEQAEDRAHRIGTTGTVNMITIVCQGTIDEAIENLVYSKGRMADMLVDGKYPAPSYNDLISQVFAA